MLDVAIKGRVGSFRLDTAFKTDSGVTALFGPSGAGKTTVLKAIAGLWTPSAGKITLNDDVFFDGRHKPMPTHHRGLGVVLQSALLFPHMDVRHNLLYAKPGGSDRFDDVVDMLDIASLLDRMPRHLSGGEAQRVALGRALISEPRLLLLDEPLTGLDDARRDAVLPFLEMLCKQAAVPIIYVSHNREEITRLADRALMISDGRIIDDMAIRDFTKLTK